MKQKKWKYWIQINLGGLTRGVLTGSDYHPACRNWPEQWYDKSGDLSCGAGDKRDDGIYQLVFDNKKDAEIALKGALMVADFVRERLGEDA